MIIGKLSKSPNLIKRLIFLIAIFGVVLYYLAGMVFPDGNIKRSRNDEQHFHLPAIQKISDSNICQAIKDYPVATFPLYHLILSQVYRLLPSEPWVIRYLNLFLTLLTTILIYYYFLNSDRTSTFYDPSFLALGISLAFISSPYVRASALSITSDNLPFLFIITGYIMLYHFKRCQKKIFIPLIALLGYSAFYTRQYYLWVPVLFLVEFLKLSQVKISTKLLFVIFSIILAIPAGYLIMVWGGPVPPTFQIHHEAYRIWMMIPFVFSFIPIYFIPLYLLYFQEKKEKKINRKNITIIIMFAFLFCFIYMHHQFNLRLIDGGGISGLFFSFVTSQYASLMFLILGYLGLVSVVFLIIKFPRTTYIWVVVLSVFLFSRVFWQKYFDPLIIFLIFLTLPTPILEKMAQRKLILLYPLMEIMLFFGTSFLYLKNVGLP